jgi:hypothetical protein
MSALGRSRHRLRCSLYHRKRTFDGARHGTLAVASASLTARDNLGIAARVRSRPCILILSIASSHRAAKRSTTLAGWSRPSRVCGRRGRTVCWSTVCGSSPQPTSTLCGYWNEHAASTPSTGRSRNSPRRRKCPLWAIIGHFAAQSPCPLYPRKDKESRSATLSPMRIFFTGVGFGIIRGNVSPDSACNSLCHDNTNTGHCGCSGMLRQRDGGGHNKSQAVRPGRASRRRGGDSQEPSAAGRPGSRRRQPRTFCCRAPWFCCARHRAISLSATARRSWTARSRRAPTRISGLAQTPRR